MKLKYSLPALVLTGALGTGCVTTEYDRSFNKFMGNIPEATAEETPLVLERRNQVRESNKTYVVIGPREDPVLKLNHSFEIYTQGDFNRLYQEQLPLKSLDNGELPLDLTNRLKALENEPDKKGIVCEIDGKSCL